MNYVVNPLWPLCEACPAEMPDEPKDPSGVACDECFAESEAAAAAAKQAEAESDFRWMSREWFRLSEYERLPFMHRIHFPARKAS
ncbi:MAG TPA: hypothetical protein VER96_37015 [Polyangiaceae bacterium]|nr:hypothetical protein [Polyangiaceae bacterium]